MSGKSNDDRIDRIDFKYKRMATRSTHTGGGGGTEQTKDNSSSLSSSSSARARQPPQQQEDRNEDNDEVVASYDVFLTQEMADRLYLLQHRWRRSDHSGYFPVSEATFRPNNKVLELEHKLDKESPHYDTESYNRKRLDTIKTVSHALPFHTCYFVGVKNKGMELLLQHHIMSSFFFYWTVSK